MTYTSASCDVCLGTGDPGTGRPCACGGSGLAQDNAQYLREQLIVCQAERDLACSHRDALRDVLRTAPGWSEDDLDTDYLQQLIKRLGQVEVDRQALLVDRESLYNQVLILKKIIRTWAELQRAVNAEGEKTVGMSSVPHVRLLKVHDIMKVIADDQSSGDVPYGFLADLLRRAVPTTP